MNVTSSRHRMHRVVAWFALVIVTTVAAACSGGGGTGAITGKSVIERRQLDVPSQILGLTVKQEDISQDIAALKSATYVSSVALFTLREGEELQASLQVAGFNDLARPNSAAFKRRVVGLMGGSPMELKVGTNKVYMIPGNQQIVYTWFRGRAFYVLTARRAYPFRRTLLRKLLVLQTPK